jgi:plastocyanin
MHMKPIMVANVLMVLAWLVILIVPGQAVPPPFEIVLDSVSPYYYPASATIPAGAPIRWENPTGSPHTITHEGCLSEDPCVFDSGTIHPGNSYSLTGLAPGRYPYQCRLHPIMRGILVIAEPAASTSQT